jgi:sulfide:quinone oxidoreductase
VTRDLRHPARVVIVGGGVAALESLLALRALAEHRVQVTMVAPERAFVYRPVTVVEAFGQGEARSYDLGELVDRAGGELVWDRAAEVRADERELVLASGNTMSYDELIIASGARGREPFPGALTFGGRDAVPALVGVLDALTSGDARSVAFTIPAEGMWVLPIYELALLAAAHVRGHRPAVEVWLVTPEEEPLELFGPAATEAIDALLAARSVRLRTSSRPARVQDGGLVLEGGAKLYVDRVVSLPAFDGPRVRGLPSDPRGFIPVDTHGRVSGRAHVFAAGDATTFPLKQGGLATQQADAAAEWISAQLGAPVTPRPFRPVLRGLLMTGGAPLYLRCEPQRIQRPASVAVEVSRPRLSAVQGSAAAGQPLWWPPAKIAGRYLAPFLATAVPQLLGAAVMSDRRPVPGSPVSEAEFDDALELALLLADCDARWGDYTAALNALEAAEALHGSLPADYEHKRREWRRAQRSS